MNPTDPFFVTGGTLSHDASSYVDRQADADLLATLLAGEYCYVLDTRQMGKSSLMVRTVQRLREHGVKSCVLDLASIGQNITPERWYAGLLMRLGGQVGLLEPLQQFWREHKELGPMQRVMEAVGSILPALGGPVVIFVDEIDAVQSLPFAMDEFFAAIRECYNRRATDPLYRSITFCLLGVATPSDLVNDPRISPFNIGRRVVLSDFTAAEAAPLAVGLAPPGAEPSAGAPPGAVRRRRSPSAGTRGGASCALSSGLLRRVLYWTGGHPYMSQRLCRAVAEEIAGEFPPPASGHRPPARRLSGRQTRAIVDSACRRLFLSHDARQVDDNLAFVRHRLLEYRGDFASLLYLYHRVRSGHRVSDDETNPLCGELRLSGVVTVRGGALRVRNRVYALAFDGAWVRDNMPDAELRRQRAAYRSGVLRAAAVGLAAVFVLGLLAITTANQADVARAAERKASSAEARSSQLNGQLQEALLSERGSNTRLVEALRALRRANGLKAAALTRATAAERSQTGEALQAMRARNDALAQRSVALHNGREADLARLAADAESQKLAHQLGADETAAGLALLQQGDSLAAITPLCSALRLDRGLSGVERADRARLTCAISHAPTYGQSWRHGAPLDSIAVSHDGRRVATGGADGIARLWDALTGRSVGGAMRCNGPVQEMAFSPDGQWLATGSRVLRVWNCVSGHAWSGDVSGAEYPRDIRWTADSRRIITAGGDAGIVWDTRTGRPLSEVLRPLGSVRGVALSPDSCRLAVASTGLISAVASTPTGTIIGALSDGYACSSVDYSPDGRLIAIAGGFGPHDPVYGVELLSATDMLPVRPVLALPGARFVRFTSDGSALVAAGGHIVHVWRLDGTLAGDREMTARADVQRIDFSPDRRRIVATDARGIAYVWDLGTGLPVCAPLRQQGGIRDAKFGRTADEVLTAGADGECRCWNIATLTDPDPQPISIPEYHSPSLLSRPGVRLWPLRNGHALFEFRAPRYPEWPTVAELYDSSTGRVLYEASGRIGGLDVSDDRLLLVTYDPAGRDGAVVLVDTRTGMRRVVASHVDSNDCRIAGTALLWTPTGSDHTDGVDTRTGRTLHFAFCHLAPIVELNGGAAHNLAIMWDSRDRWWAWHADTARFTRLAVAREISHGTIMLDGQRGHALLQSADGREQLANTNTGAALTALVPARRLQPDYFATDGSLGVDFRLELEDIARLRTLAASRADIIDMSVDGRCLCTYLNGAFRLWSSHAMVPLGPPREIGSYGGVVFSPDGSRLTVIGERGPLLLSARTGALVAASFPGAGPGCQVAFSATGSTLIVVSHREGWVQLFRALDGSRMGPAITINGDPGLVVSSPDDRLVAVSTSAAAMQIWDVATGTPVSPSVDCGWPGALRFGVDGSRIIAIYWDGATSGGVHSWRVPYRLPAAQALLVVGDLLGAGANTTSRAHARIAGGGRATGIHALRTTTDCVLALSRSSPEARAEAEGLAHSRWRELDNTVRAVSRMAMVRLAVQQRDWESALPLLNAAEGESQAQFSPGYGELLRLRARTRAHLGDWRGARADYSRALALSPGSAPILVARAVVLDQLGDPEAADKDLRVAQDAIPVWSRAERISAAAQAIVQRDLWLDTVEDLGGSLSISAVNDSLIGCARALALIALGHTDAAERELTALTAATQEDARVLRVQLNLHLATGDLVAATADADRLVRAEPTNWRYYEGRAAIRMQRGDYAGAGADLTSAITSNPDDVRLLMSRSAARRVLGDLRGAASDLEHVMLLGSVAAGAQASLLYAASGDLVDYTRVCNLLLHRDETIGNNTNANMAAWACVTAASPGVDYSRALVLAQQLITTAAAAGSRNAIGHDMLNTVGGVLLRAGRYDDAIRIIERAVSLGQSEDPTDNVFLALAARKLGRTEMAAKWARRAEAELVARLNTEHRPWYDTMSDELFLKELRNSAGERP